MKPTALAHFFANSVDTTELLTLPTDEAVQRLADEQGLFFFIEALAEFDVHDPALASEFEAEGHVASLFAFRQLRVALSLKLGKFLTEVSTFLQIVDDRTAAAWLRLADRVIASPEVDRQLKKVVRSGALAEKYEAFEQTWVERDAHVVYPTSPYRTSAGHVVSNESYTEIDGVIQSTVTTSIRVADGVLDPSNTLLREIYGSHRRCIAFVDSNVDKHFREAIQAYFKHHNISLSYLVHRAMEVDKDISNVEKILSELKTLGASRNEPILIVGGGVLADIAGFASALYHRSTPYVMLNTSVVSGIDAGPSPRTCADGYGYKNLFGAYAAPIVSITDRTFFRTLHKGWIRHGIAEIIKMGGVKDIELIDMLEEVGPALVDTAFGTIDTKPGSRVDVLSKRILGAALKSYVQSEYDNLYETHQCRPHAFGHTWSPGFEIASGMLHGHAVSVGMGWNGYLSYERGWLTEAELKRLLDVIDLFDLSLWNNVLLDFDLLWAAQEKMIQKRGGNLAAPLPKVLGQVGYLNDLSREEMEASILAYQKVCDTYPRGGIGVEPLCIDVGLEDPGTVGQSPFVVA